MKLFLDFGRGFLELPTSMYVDDVILFVKGQ